jgi:predicted permease
MDEELQDELQFHLEMQARKIQDRDLDPAQANRQARLQFGSIVHVTEECREQRGISAIEIVVQDVRYGLHLLRRNPAFTIAALLLLALGIGATTAVFTVARQVLLHGLAVENPSELTELEFDDTANHIVGTEFSYPAFQIFVQPNPLISGMFARSEPIQVNITTNGVSDIVHAVFDSASISSVLGLSPALGRLLNEGDAKGSGDTAPIVLSYRCWQRHFGGDPNLIGRVVSVNTTPFVIVGVNPPNFHGIQLGIDPDVMLPAYTADLIRGVPTLNNRASWGFTIICRRKPGVAQDQVRASLSPAFAAVLADFPSAVPASMGGQMRQFASHLRFRVGSASLGATSDSRSQLGRDLLLLMLITGVVYLITCANLTGLILSKMEARTFEIGTRLALGCGRHRLLFQLLTESTLLALFGGTLGVLTAFWLSPLIPRLLASNPVGELVRPDMPMLVYGLALAMVSGILIGLVPAVRASRLDPLVSIRNSSPSGGRTHSGIARTLIVSQVAGSLILALIAGQFVRSLQNYESLDAGFRPDHLILVSVRMDLVQYDNPRKIGYERQLYARLSEVPGVKSVTFATSAFGKLTWNTLASVPGYAPKGTLDDTIGRNIVGPRFLETLGLRLIAGRDFDPRDNEQSPATVIVNKSFARHFFGTDDVLGRQISFIDSSKRADTIIGIAGDAFDRGVKQPPKPVVYSNYEHDPLGWLTFSVRVTRDPKEMLSGIISIFKQIDSKVPIEETETAEAQMDSALQKEQMLASLSVILGALALVVSMVGLYGLLAYSTARRTHEIGIRIALGARRDQIRWLAIRESARLMLCGTLLGGPVYLALSRLFRAQVYHVQALDPAAVCAAVCLLIICGALATYIPAARACRVNPVKALKYE